MIVHIVTYERSTLGNSEKYARFAWHYSGAIGAAAKGPQNLLFALASTCSAGPRHRQPHTGEGWKSQGRVLSSIFLDDWQLFLLSSSFSSRWGCVCNEPSQFTSGPNDAWNGLTAVIVHED